MNEQPLSEFEAKLRELLAAPDAEAAFVARLRSQLKEKGKVETTRRFSPRLAWGLVALIVLVAALLAFSPPVAQAMKRLLGYIPRVGFVERGPTLRVMSAPVMLRKDGLTVTIEKGVADTQRTVILARVEGYPAGRSGPPTCQQSPQLVSSDGTVQRMVEGTTGSEQQDDAVLFVRYEFEAMPANSFDVTLDIPCLMFDADFPNWSAPLHFRVAEGADQGAAVIELPTRMPTQPASPAAFAPAAESAPAGFSIVLKSAAELPDGYVLSGSYQWNDTSVNRFSVVISDSNMLDAHGQPVPYEQVGADPVVDAGPQQIPFAYQIAGKDIAWPLSIVVNAITVIQPGQGTFEFDPGPNPQVGRIWNVDLDVPVGRHDIRVDTIELTGGIPNMPYLLGYAFTMTSDPKVASATVEELNPVIDCKVGCGGGGGGGMDFGVSGTTGATGPFYYGTKANGYSPAGVKTFVISNVSVFFKGPWRVSWQP